MEELLFKRWYWFLFAVYDDFTGDCPVVIQLYFHEIMPSGELRYIHLLQVFNVLRLCVNKLAIRVVNPDLPHVLTFDVVSTLAQPSAFVYA